MGTVEESYRGFGWIKVPRYVMDESLTWEEPIASSMNITSGRQRS